MIFGKSYTQKYREKQDRLKEMYGKQYKVFAWWPVRLQTGELAWLEHLWLDAAILKFNGMYMYDSALTGRYYKIEG